MSAFSHGFNNGFKFGMLNNMFGGGCCNPFMNGFGMGFNPFGGFCNSFNSFFNCSHNFMGWNSAPLFMVPRFNFNNFVQYQTPSLQAPTVWNVSVPNFSAAPIWNNVNYSMPSCSFTPSWKNQPNWGDTFTRTSSSAQTSSGSTESNVTAKMKHYTQMTDAEMYEVYGGYSKDVTVLYKGTAEDLNKYLKGKGKLEGKGQAFMNAQKKYGISAAVLVGIAMNESGGGTSRLARQQNNVGGVRIAGSSEFKTFSCVEDCIDNMASFLSRNYVKNPGRPLTKLYQINAKYCPASDPTDRTGGNSRWASAVNKFSTEVEEAIA